jgi:DNA-binding CsgD family transcriptional regulator
MPKNRDDSIGFPELHTQLRITNRLLAAQLKAVFGQQEMVRLLSTSGATNTEIADVLDTTPATVTATLQRLKKKGTRTALPAGDEASGDGGTSL